MYFYTLQHSTQNMEGFKTVTPQWKNNNGAEIFKNQSEEGDNPICAFMKRTQRLSLIYTLQARAEASETLGQNIRAGK